MSRGRKKPNSQKERRTQKNSNIPWARRSRRQTSFHRRGRPTALRCLWLLTLRPIQAHAGASHCRVPTLTDIGKKGGGGKPPRGQQTLAPNHQEPLPSCNSLPWGELNGVLEVSRKSEKRRKARFCWSGGFCEDKEKPDAQHKDHTPRKRGVLSDRRNTTARAAAAEQPSDVT